MNKLYILLIVFFGSSTVFSQRANLDRETFKVSHVILPSKPILTDSIRTFSSNTKNIYLKGFSRVSSDGTLDVNYSFNGTETGEVDIKKTKHEKKNKEGKVISTTYTYKIHVSYSSSGDFSVNNSDNPANNYETTYSNNSNYTSSSFKQYSKAKDYYNNNRYTIRNKYTKSHKKNILSKANSYLNSTYGYQTRNYNYEIFWILGRKKHPEYEKHMEAYNSLKTAFATMKHDQPVDELKTQVQPIIDYFNSLIPKYSGSKKRMRKMRYASYFNVAKIYYYLDMPEKTKEYAQKLIDNDYDKKDGKYFIKIADRLLEDFKVNKINTRHFKVVTEDLTK